MAISNSSAPSFLREALISYAQYTAEKKQDAQKRALKWLQTYLESEQCDPTIFKQFTQQWRTGQPTLSSTNKSPLNLENLPRSYKGSKSINGHQETALNFLHQQVPPEIQDDFQARWNAKTMLKVSNASGTCLKIDEKDLAALQETDPVGSGKTWYPLNQGDIYYLLSYEEKGDYYLVTMTEDVGLENRNIWWVFQKDVNVSNI